MGLMAVFTSPPEFTVLHGRDEIGRTDPALLTDQVDGPRLLLLGGRSWRVTWTDWKRRCCFVEPAEGRGRALDEQHRSRRTVLRTGSRDA
jgi:ATP-dependent Lhr-like helicase